MKQDRVVPLYRADEFPAPLTGAKAGALARLHGAGLSVPDGVCVTSRWFAEVASRTDIGRLVEHHLRDLGANPTGTGRSLELIRRALTRTPWPGDLVAEVSEAARRLLTAGPVMVRSSVPVEDGAGLSYAGVFESEGPLESVPDVLAALGRCWAALYSARVVAYARGQLPGEYAAFLQSWVRPDAHGVLFTRDPVTHADGPITDVAWGNATDTTSGRANGGRVALTAGDDESGVTLPRALRESLNSLAERGEQLFGRPLDIEWVWSDGHLHTLQARPITHTTTATRAPAAAWWPDSDVGALHDVGLGLCRRRFEGALMKHIWLRRQCAALDVPTYREAYVVYRPEDTRRLADELAGHLRTEYVQINWAARGTGTVAPLAELALHLKRGHERNPLDDPAYCAAHIGEIVPAEASGFSAVLSDGTVVIEAFPAGLPGIKEGGLVPSVFTVSPAGKVAREHIATFARRCRIEPGEGWWWHPEDTPPYVFDRSNTEVLDIARVTRALCESLGEARVEWYTDDGRAMIRDVSLEGGRLDAPSAPGGQLISGGVASGTVLHLPDLGDLDEAARALEVSVVGSGTDNAAVMADARITAAVDAVSRATDVIVVAEYPSAGLIPLVDLAAGFVFRRGNLLCHTAIVLRERGVPAIVSAGAAGLRDGMTVEISPAGVTVLSDREQTC
ncbi:PEP/pyruvate-binding domain-containing protein [Streptomyces scopuliridis]|uniref:PEP/pyruvate-binding domain-containing protein n=1 Tax=Streptomyces scopuliridis TaxID=452529 RepID=UPI0036BEBDA1